MVNIYRPNIDNLYTNATHIVQFHDVADFYTLKAECNKVLLCSHKRHPQEGCK